MLKSIVKNSFRLVVFGYWLLALVGLWLLARFFLPSGYTLAGHDSGLPLDAGAFLYNRIFAWNEQINFGADNSHLFGSLPLHFVDYLSSIVGGTPAAGNYFNLFFWIALLFSAALFFSYQLKNIIGFYFVFIFPPLVIFNFYLFQSIYILERAKYSILVGILLFLPIVLRLQQRKISLLLASIIAAFIFFIWGSGSLLGLPLYGNLFAIVFGLLVFYSIEGMIRKNFSNLLRLVSFLILTFSFFLLLNSYQLLPILPHILGDDYIVHAGGDVVAKRKDWVDYISQNTSFLNILRLQGVPSWFSDKDTVSLQHPYAKEYLSNPLLILVSFILPAIAFLSLVVARRKSQRRVVFLFALVVLISIVFTAGTHPPYGWLYGLLFDYIPGFFIFRTPYYKFAGAFFLGISVLIAAASSILIDKAHRWLLQKSVPDILKVIVGPFLCAVVISLWLAYHYNLLIPDEVFTWKTGFSTRFQVPDYVWNFLQWNRQQNIANQKILLFPPLEIKNRAEGYEWGYWSLSPIHYALASVPGLVNDLSLTSEEEAWLEELYESLEARDEEKTRLLAKKLGIGYLIFREDVTGSQNQQKFQEVLYSMSGLKKVESLGSWGLYRFETSEVQRIYAISSLTVVPGNGKYLAREFATAQNVVAEPLDPVLEDSLRPFIDLKLRTYFCQSCLLERIDTSRDLPAVRIFPNSPLYFLKERNEKKELEAAKDDTSKVLTYLSHTFRRTSEVRSMIILGNEDKHIMKNLETVNAFLAEANNLLKRHPEFTTDYVVARRAFDITTPLLTQLHKFVLTDDFGRRQNMVREEVYKVIVGLNKLNDFYSPITHGFDELRNTKVYYIAPEKELYIDSLSLPSNANSKLHRPTTILYKSRDVESKLDMEDTGGRWLKIIPPQGQVGTATVTLQFDQPNLFQTDRNSLQFFPSGWHGCLSGKIANFNPDKSYEIVVSGKSKAQTLALFFQYQEKETDIYGKFVKAADIYPIENTVPYRYVYDPETGESIPMLFLCTDDRDFPDIDKLAVYEMISPILVAADKIGREVDLTPSLSYEQIDPTRYVISVQNATEPFVLILNQHYSRFWTVYPVNSPEEAKDKLTLSKKRLLYGTKDASQFQINGYANAWIVKPDSQSILVLEYFPQGLFYLGVLLSGISLVVLASAATWIIFWQPKTKP